MNIDNYERHHDEPYERYLFDELNDIRVSRMSPWRSAFDDDPELAKLVWIALRHDRNDNDFMRVYAVSKALFALPPISSRTKLGAHLASDEEVCKQFGMAASDCGTEKAVKVIVRWLRRREHVLNDVIIIANEAARLPKMPARIKQPAVH